MALWRKREQLKKDYQTVFGSDSGKRVLKDLMKRGFIFGSTANRDTHVTYMNEGKRSLVLEIVRTLEINPAQYRKLYGESLDEHLENMENADV